MKMQMSIIPQEIVTQYNLEYVVDIYGWIYIKICKGMYDLKQEGMIENQECIQYLKLYGYHPVTFIPSLWNHEDTDKMFSLVVDNFAIDFISEEMRNISSKHSQISTKYQLIGKHSCGITCNAPSACQCHIMSPKY